MTSEKLHWGSPNNNNVFSQSFINTLEQIKLIKWQENLEDITMRTHYPDFEPSDRRYYYLKLRV